MIVYRIAKAEYANDLSGRGAELVGGRWSSRGVARIYTSESRSLCTAELAVHIPLGILPEGFKLISLEIPDELIEEFTIQDLPEHWMSFPYVKASQLIGDRFVLNSKQMVLRVPSAVVEGEFNYLINPKHPLFKKVSILSIQDYHFDKHLFI